ncbi:DUF63 family protein [Halococcus sp. IIIV-5B]|uniref:DUF63 family protein n=1 Tax=Halococcus sp. IIIV-5B TaxID=2321230 RepID=UPI000E75FF1B|nr:DUF63 family protein [Halococcus sp. IIIV-5B]RJT02053.1 DUF63 family protein [Halococcus sp. IIIV-5B]
MQVLQILPEGSTLPPLPYLVVLALALAGVALALRRLGPRVTDRVVVSFAPWMVVGSSCYVLYQVYETSSFLLKPFFSSPTVYVSVAVLAGAVWAASAAADLPVDRWRPPSVPSVVGLSGALLAVVVVGWALVWSAPGDLHPVWPAVALAVAVVCAVTVWAALRRLVPATRVTGLVGGLCVFGHALDGVSTAVGIDVLGFGERSPFSRAIIEFAATLPTAPILGAGWLFVVTKLALAAAVLVLLASYVCEEPGEGTLLLGAVAAVGLGPGAHNLLLFTIAS